MAELERPRSEVHFRSRYNGFELRLDIENRTITKVMRTGSTQAHREVDARRILAQIGSNLAPKLLDVVVRGDKLEVISTYIQRSHEHLAAASPVVLRELLHELARVHRATLVSPGAFPATEARQRAESALDALISLAGISTSSTLAGESRNNAINLAGRIALTHRDLTDDNIIVDEERAWVIDWETSTYDFFLMDIVRLRLSLSPEQQLWAVDFYLSCLEPQLEITAQEIELAELVFLGQMLQYLKNNGRLDEDYGDALLRRARLLLLDP